MSFWFFCFQRKKREVEVEVEEREREMKPKKERKAVSSQLKYRQLTVISELLADLDEVGAPDDADLDVLLIVFCELRARGEGRTERGTG